MTMFYGHIPKNGEKGGRGALYKNIKQLALEGASRTSSKLIVKHVLFVYKILKNLMEIEF